MHDSRITLRKKRHIKILVVFVRTERLLRKLAILVTDGLIYNDFLKFPSSSSKEDKFKKKVSINLYYINSI